jgi:poly(3-hydroxybutyrate) depolymerase
MFTELSVTIDSIIRNFKYKIPTKTLSNGKYGLVIILHGSGGNSNSVIKEGTSTLKLINDILNNGFVVLVPDARSEFGVSPFKPRWESETDSNNDISFLNYLVSKLPVEYNFSFNPKIDTTKIFLIGGSGGGVFASNLANKVDNKILAGIVEVNSCDYRRAYLDGNKIIWKDNSVDQSVKTNHPNVLLIFSSTDDIIPLNVKIDRYANLYNDIKGRVSYKMNNNEGSIKGYHNWDIWTEEFHPDIIKFIINNQSK